MNTTKKKYTHVYHFEEKPIATKVRGLMCLSQEIVSGGTGKIYVPDNLVNAFKTATNWSALAEFIKPMSQWTNPYE